MSVRLRITCPDGDPINTKFEATIGAYTFDQDDLPAIRIYKHPDSNRTDITIIATSDLPHADEVVLDVEDSATWRKIQADGAARRAAE